jgi:hypothetical protein
MLSQGSSLGQIIVNESVQAMMTMLDHQKLRDQGENQGANLL